MIKEIDPTIHLAAVKNYYITAQKYYERVWYNGNRGLGLHYGFWPEGVHDKIEAITKENEILADIAEIKAGDLVLDAGCGVGGSGIWLAKNRGAKVVELNIANNQLLIGKKLARKNFVSESLYFTEADYHRLPFENAFDVFWSLESIEHSYNLEQLIDGAKRSLKSGGRAVIAGTFKGKSEPTDMQIEQLNVGFRAAGAFNDFRSAEEVATLMTQAGFSNVENRDVTSWVMPSARQMRIMCQLGLPGAQLGHKMGIISEIMVNNTTWGTYQEGLFHSQVTSYNIITAKNA